MIFVSYIAFINCPWTGTLMLSRFIEIHCINLHNKISCACCRHCNPHDNLSIYFSEALQFLPPCTVPFKFCYSSTVLHKYVCPCISILFHHTLINLKTLLSIIFCKLIHSMFTTWSRIKLGARNWSKKTKCCLSRWVLSAFCCMVWEQPSI